MNITIKLFASIGSGRLKTEVHEFLHETKVRDVVVSLGLPEEKIGIVLINGQHASQADSLKDGDTLSLLPLVDGD